MGRILLASAPFSGHLHPTLALGRRLAQRHGVAGVAEVTGRLAAALAGLAMTATGA